MTDLIVGLIGGLICGITIGVFLIAPWVYERGM